MDKQEEKLDRSLSATMLAIYGAGTILGAGIFVLIGKVVGKADLWTPLAFLVAAIVAGVNGMAYAELATRSPGAGGPSDYVHKAFGQRWFSNLIGWMIIATGVVSCATITTGFSGYLTHFVDVPKWLAKVGLLVILGGVAIAGAKESAWFMAITTSMGVLGLGMVIYAAFFTDGQRFEPAEYFSELPAISDTAVLTGLLSATFLAVYSFIGFEDMVHMAEEVKKPAKSIPKAIAVAVGVAALLYVLVSYASLMVLEPSALEESKAPLVAVVKEAGLPVWPLAILSLAIILNGALAQIIMSTRVIYSMGDKNGVPQVLASVNKTTKTPLLATLISTGVAMAFALFLPLETLASITSMVMLLVFVAANASLIKLERHEPKAPFDTPKSLPWIALVLCIILIAGQFVFGGGGH